MREGHSAMPSGGESTSWNCHYPTQEQFADAILAAFRPTLPIRWRSFRHGVPDRFGVISWRTVDLSGKAGTRKNERRQMASHFDLAC